MRPGILMAFMLAAAGCGRRELLPPREEQPVSQEVRRSNGPCTAPADATRQVPPPGCEPACGNHVCEPGEDCATCPGDCGHTLSFSVSNLLPAPQEDIILSVDPALVSGPEPRWDLGTGEHLQGNPITYRYSTPGTYPVVLTATESRCLTPRVSAPMPIRVQDVAVPCARPERCGNQVCEPCEHRRCPGDCGTSCGNRVCDPGEDCASCAYDCGLRPTFTFSPQRPVVDEPVTFTATPGLITDPAPEWDLGNGEHRSGNPLVHAYREPGAYTVVLKAREARCGSTQSSVPLRLTVLDRAVPRGNASQLAFSNLPRCLRPGTTFQAQVVMVNTGELAWSATQHYALGAPQGTDPFTGVDRIPLAPNEVVLRPHSMTFRFTLRAPDVEGTYPSAWQMRHNPPGRPPHFFGDVAREDIQVSRACGDTEPTRSYGCEVTVRDEVGAPVAGAEASLEAFHIPVGQTPLRVGVSRERTDLEGRATLSVSPTAPIQSLFCGVAGIDTTGEPHVSVSDPVEVPPGTRLRLDLTVVDRVPARVRFGGLKAGEAVARLYQSGPYDRPVVIPTPFDPKEQTVEAFTEEKLYARFGPFVEPLYELGYDVWLVKTKSGQNIHEQAAEFAQAVQYAASRLGPGGKVIIAAYSLGGVTARLATSRWDDPEEGAWRTALGLPEALPVSLLVFGDAPLEGAQINVCLQRAIWDDLGRAHEGNLNSCAAQQLLRESYSGFPDQTNFRENFENHNLRGREVVFSGAAGVCDHFGRAPHFCHCDAGPAVFLLNRGTGFASVPTIAFADGTAGTITCYGDDRDLNFAGNPVCAGPGPRETRPGDDLYKIRVPLGGDHICKASPTDTEGGSRLSVNPTEVKCFLPTPYDWPFLPAPHICGGVEQLATAVFIPYSSALPWRGPFLKTREQGFHGVHAKGYRDLACWSIEEMNRVSGLPLDCQGRPRSAKGRATLQRQSQGPALPPRLVTGTPHAFYTLAPRERSRATGQEPLDVCVDTTGLVFMDASAVGLYQHQDGTWRDITSYRSTEKKRVCGRAAPGATYALLEPTNRPPRAHAGPDLALEATRPEGAVVRLNGAGSLEPDREFFQLEWRDAHGKLLASTAVADVVLPPGRHELTLTATDPRGGRTTDGAITEVRDTRPPQAFVAAPGPGTRISHWLSLSADASDAVGVTGGRFQLDGADLGPVLATPPFSLDWDSRTVRDGSHTLTVVAWDAAGNRTVSAPIPLLVDNTPPSLELAATPSLLPPSGEQLVPVTVDVRVSDAQDATPTVRLASVSCRDRPGPPQAPRCEPARDIQEAHPGTDDRRFELRASPARFYEATYSATDAAGNTRTATVVIPVGSE